MLLHDLDEISKLIGSAVVTETDQVEGNYAYNDDNIGTLMFNAYIYEYIMYYQVYSWLLALAQAIHQDVREYVYYVLLSLLETNSFKAQQDQYQHDCCNQYSINQCLRL